MGNIPDRLHRKKAGVLLSLAGVLIAICLLPGETVWGGENPGAQSLVGKEIAGATLTDSNDRLYLLPARQPGKIDVVNFWGIRCGSCLEELPELERLYVKYKAKGLTVYGINADAVSWDSLSPLLKKMNINVSFPLFADKGLDMMDAYQVMATPMTVVLDDHGIVRSQHVGYSQGDEKILEEEITRLLEPGR